MVKNFHNTNTVTPTKKEELPKYIKKGVKEVCEISTEIATLYADNNALVAKLNSVPQDELQKASDYYASRSGVIVDLRKDVLKFLNLS